MVNSRSMALTDSQTEHVSEIEAALLDAELFMKSSASSKAASISLTCSACESVSAIEREFTISVLRLVNTKSCVCWSFLSGKCALQVGKTDWHATCEATDSYEPH